MRQNNSPKVAGVNPKALVKAEDTKESNFPVSNNILAWLLYTTDVPFMIMFFVTTSFRWTERGNGLVAFSSSLHSLEKPYPHAIEYTNNETFCTILLMAIQMFMH